MVTPSCASLPTLSVGPTDRASGCHDRRFDPAHRSGSFFGVVMDLTPPMRGFSLLGTSVAEIEESTLFTT